MLHATLLLTAVAVSQAEIDTKYLKFSDQTMYARQLSTEPAGEYINGLTVFATHSGEKRKRAADSDSVTLLFSVGGPKARFEGDHKVVIMQGRDEFVIRSFFKEQRDEQNRTIAGHFHVQMTIGEARKRLERDEPWKVKLGVQNAEPIGPITRDKLKDFLDFIQAPLVDQKHQDKPREEPLRKKGAVSISQHDIKTNYDKLSDYTVYRRQLGEIQDDNDAVSLIDAVSLSVSALHRGEAGRAIPDSGHITLNVFRSSPRWRYLNDHDVIVMEGRNRFRTEARYIGDTSKEGDRVNEFVHIDIRVGEAKEHVSGEDWEVKIGTEKPFHMGLATRRKIKEFLDYIQAPASGTSDGAKKNNSPKQAISQPEIDVQYDKFDDETRYNNGIDDQYDGKEYRALSLHANHKGEKRRRLDDSEVITLLVYRRGHDWLYLKDHDVIVMEGRDRFVIRTDYAHEIDNKDPKCNEYVHILMPISEARKRLASGRDWEIKIGTERPFSLDGAMRKKIAAFLNYLQEPSIEGPEQGEVDRRASQQKRRRAIALANGLSARPTA
jgi:hypothetical protein